MIRETHEYKDKKGFGIDENKAGLNLGMDILPL
jgi:hypothetical protein